MMEWGIWMTLYLSWIFSSDSTVQVNQHNQSAGLISCELIVDAGPDVALCFPGDEVMLMGSVTGEYVQVEWTPSDNLSDPFILNPVADITAPVTYVLTVYGFDSENPNLVVNGDFEDGNTGFISDYSYLADLPGFQEMDEGEYGVLPNPNTVHGGWQPCEDHTTGNGNLLVLNGAPDFQNVWCQDIDVMPNTWYNVDAWVSSVHPVSPANLQFSINGIEIGPIITAPGATCVWIPFNSLWFSGSATTATLCILNQNTTMLGNDFALDDISMRELCMVQDEVNITLIGPPDEPVINADSPLCPGAGTTITTPANPDVSFDWNTSNELDIISGQGTNEIAVMWAGDGQADICLTVSSDCGSSETCISINALPENETFFDLVLCEGETIEINGTIYGNGNWFGVESFISVDGCDSLVYVDVEEAPSSQEFITEFLCTGESIFLEGAYQSESGIYTDVFQNSAGCDSIIITELIVSDTDSTFVTSYTCDAALAGVIITTFTNGNCDSVVTSEVILISSDTVLISQTSCIPADTGEVMQVLTNVGGCDSVVITYTALVSADTVIFAFNTCDPEQEGSTIDTFQNLSGCDSIVITNISYAASDTTMLFEQSCSYADTGTVTNLLVNTEGCDSLVITWTTYAASDTTILFAQSCSYADTGRVANLLVNIEGCDSLVILQTSYAGSDTLFITGATCNPAEAGQFITAHLNEYGCDSIVSTFIVLLPFDTSYISFITCDPDDAGVVTTSYMNQFGCDSVVITTAILDDLANCVFEANIQADQPLCFGDTGWIEINLVAGLAPFIIQWQNEHAEGLDTFEMTGHYLLPVLSGGQTEVSLLSANGLVVKDTVLINELVPLAAEAVVISDFSGYGVPCYQDSLGEVQINIASGGTSPFSFSWSNGSTDQLLTALPKGQYEVTITDAHGCAIFDEVEITEPPPLQYELIVTDIACFDATGSIEVSEIMGGVEPWSVFLDGNDIIPGLSHDGIEEGPHELVILDGNMCRVEEDFLLTVLSNWDVSLPDDTILPYGSVFALQASISGTPNGGLALEWLDEKCENCLTREIEVTTMQTYIVTVIDSLGCMRQDTMVIRVSDDAAVYIPNVFSPNGDQINDRFLIFTNPAVEEIEELSVFDRWGDYVFQRYHFLPNDPELGWDGSMKNKVMNPGVFAYKARIRYRDGRRELKHGDVTLIR